MPKPKKRRAKQEWSMITLTVLKGRLPNAEKYRMLFENYDTAKSVEGETSVDDVKPTPHFKDVCVYLADKYKCPVRLDCGERSDPRFIQFDI